MCCGAVDGLATPCAPVSTSSWYPERFAWYVGRIRSRTHYSGQPTAVVHGRTAVLEHCPRLAQEYFAEGLTEDLTTDLSRIPGSFVIAPSTAFSYRGKPIDVRQIGRELSVRYVLQGSVRRILDSIRINA